MRDVKEKLVECGCAAWRGYCKGTVIGMALLSVGFFIAGVIEWLS